MAHILQLNSTQLNSTQLNSTQQITPLQNLISPAPPLKTCPRMFLSGKGNSGGFACFAKELFINAFS